MAKKKLKMLVLSGGPSSEHDISLKTADMVIKNLDKTRYVVVREVIPKTGKWELPEAKADIAFIAMHGEFGEDGKLQAILDRAGIPYTGSGAKASALGMDKERSQTIFASFGLNVPQSYFFASAEFKKDRGKVFKNITEKFSLPVVIKPTDRGSSVGASVVHSADEFGKAISNAVAVSANIMAQEFIAGTELTCGIFDDGKDNLTPLLPTEIVPKMGGFFDYASKYTESGSDEITPARVPPEILKEAEDTAVKSHIAIGCGGFSRTDMIWSRNQSKIYVLEINTIPGLTPQSLFPKAALASGIAFPRLLDMLIASALSKKL